jgi:hypothetical protein
MLILDWGLGIGDWGLGKNSTSSPLTPPSSPAPLLPCPSASSAIALADKLKASLSELNSNGMARN